MAQLVFLSSFVYWKHLAGFTALDCWFGRQLEWERWLVVGWLFLKAKTCWASGGSRFSPSKSRSGADSENKIECKETTSTETGNGFGKEKQRKELQVDRWCAHEFRRSTWCAGYHSGSEPPWLKPGGLGRCSGQTRGCLQHCNTDRRRHQMMGRALHTTICSRVSQLWTVSLPFARSNCAFEPVCELTPRRAVTSITLVNRDYFLYLQLQSFIHKVAQNNWIRASVTVATKCLPLILVRELWLG